HAYQSSAFGCLLCRGGEGAPAGWAIGGEACPPHALPPPWEVVESYHQVTQAMERRDQQKNDARATATPIERDAQARRVGIVRQAKAAAREQVTVAEAVRDAFLTRRRARVALSEEEECRLLSDALEWMEMGAKPADVCRAYGARRTAAIARQVAVADFRLFWGALGAA